MNVIAKARKINVSLPAKLAEYVESKVDVGLFHYEADFIRHAIRKMQESETVANDFDLDAYIQQGIDSGRSPRSAKEIFEDAHAKIDKVGRQKKASNN